NDHLLAGRVGKIACVHFYDRPIFFFDGILVEIKKYRSLLCQRALRIERVVLAASTCANSACGGTGGGSGCSGARSFIQFDRATASCKCGSQTNDGKTFEKATSHKGLPTVRAKR